LQIEREKELAMLEKLASQQPLEKEISTNVLGKRTYSS
jgi:hypothetical protein